MQTPRSPAKPKAPATGEPWKKVDKSGPPPEVSPMPHLPMPYGFVPPRFLPPVPPPGPGHFPPLPSMGQFPYMAPPLLNARGMPYNNLLPGLAPPWARHPFPPISGPALSLATGHNAPPPPFAPNPMMRSSVHPGSPASMSRSPSPFPLPLAPPFPLFPNFPPSGPFMDLPPAVFSPSSAAGLPEGGPDSRAPSGDKVLPRGVDLPTMLSSPELQMAWHAHLVSTSQHKEAEALRNLLSRPPPPPASEVAAERASESVGRPLHTQSPDSGCFSSPPDTTSSSQPKNLLPSANDALAESMFEQLLTDFESSWPASAAEPASSEELSVPLYMRRAHSEERREEEICVLDESILAFALESQPENAGNSDPPPKPRQPFPPALALMPTNSITASNPLRPREPEAPLSYAGVLRTPPKTVETDPIQKIRNLGAVGSQVL